MIEDEDGNILETYNFVNPKKYSEEHIEEYEIYVEGKEEFDIIETVCSDLKQDGNKLFVWYLEGTRVMIELMKDNSTKFFKTLEKELTELQKDLELLIPDSVLSNKVYTVNDRITVTDISSVDLTDTGREQMKELQELIRFIFKFMKTIVKYLETFEKLGLEYLYDRVQWNKK